MDDTRARNSERPDMELEVLSVKVRNQLGMRSMIHTENMVDSQAHFEPFRLLHEISNGWHEALVIQGPVKTVTT